MASNELAIIPVKKYYDRKIIYNPYDIYRYSNDWGTKPQNEPISQVQRWVMLLLHRDAISRSQRFNEFDNIFIHRGLGSGMTAMTSLVPLIYTSLTVRQCK